MKIPDRISPEYERLAAPSRPGKPPVGTAAGTLPCRRMLTRPR